MKIKLEDITVYDNEGETFDRYTVYVKEGTVFNGYAMSFDPTSPLGVNQFIGTALSLQPIVDGETTIKEVPVPDCVVKGLEYRGYKICR